MRIELSLALTYLWAIGGAGTVAGYQIGLLLMDQVGVAWAQLAVGARARKRSRARARGRSRGWKLRRARAPRA